MGSLLSKPWPAPNPDHRSPESKVDTFVVCLNCKETAQRLKQLRPCIRYSDQQLSSIIRTYAAGVALERQLIRIEKEIGYTTRELEKLETERRVYLGQQVAAWEDLLPRFKQYVEDLRLVQDCYRLPDERIYVEGSRLTIALEEQADELRRLRCQVMADLKQEKKPLVKSAWTVWLDWVTQAELRAQWEREAEAKERERVLKEVAEEAVRFYHWYKRR